MKPILFAFLMLIVSCKEQTVNENYLGIVNIEVSDDATFCSAANRNQTSPSMVIETEIMMTQLMVLSSCLDNDPVTAEKLLLKSVELEEGLSYSYGPPVIQKPTHELYADWLLEQNRNEEAELYYKATLVRAPKRRLSEYRLKGISEA